jgi:hypothetical protein
MIAARRRANPSTSFTVRIFTSPSSSNAMRAYRSRIERTSGAAARMLPGNASSWRTRWAKRTGSSLRM